MVLFISIVLGYISATLSEYLLHRLYLHKTNDEDHVVYHHIDYNSREHYVVSTTTYSEVASSVSYILLTASLTFPVAILGHLIGIVHLPLFMVVGVGYAFLLEIMHVHYHKGTQNVLTSSKYFKKLAFHHYIHHMYYDKNFGIGSRLWDFILRTYRTNE